jgi:glycosyltransferase involved in cell wall biosynthesis
MATTDEKPINEPEELRGKPIQVMSPGKILYEEIRDSESLYKNPLVSIVCTAYNHEPYIAKALDSFVMQQTSFPIEIVVHDDASTDNTAAIIRQYESKYPKLFVCIYQTENQYSKPERDIYHDIVIPITRGKYIAICEGDDYWIDPTKLEKQVTFMELGPNLSMSFHAARVDFAEGNRRSIYYFRKGRSILKPKEVIVGGNGFYATCTAMFKREVFDDYPAFFFRSPVGDAIWALNAIRKGDVGYIDKAMAVYNNGVPGSWTEMSSKQELSKKLERFITMEDVRNQFDQYTGYKFSSAIRKINSIKLLCYLKQIVRKGQKDENYAALKARLIFMHKCEWLCWKVAYWLKHKLFKLTA